MNRLMQILSILLLTLSLIQCSTFDKEKWLNNRKVIGEAGSNKQLITITYKGTDKKSNNMIVGFVKYCELTNDSFDFQDFQSKKLTGLLIRQNIDSVSFINAENKIRVCLSDQSTIIGNILSSDIDNNNIVFEAHNKKYTIPGSKILNMKLFDINYVKVVFLDGSEIYGSIKEDDGQNVYIATILGDESYPRKDILRIDYVK